MGFLIVVFVFLFMLLLLNTPLILDARIRLGLRGAPVRASLYVFGLIPIPIRFTVRLFSEPYFTLQIGKKEIPLLTKKRKGGEIGLLQGVRLLWLETVTTVGITDDPARAVICAGSIATALSMLTSRYAESGAAKARPSDRSMIRIAIRVEALLFPLEMLTGFVCFARKRNSFVLPVRR